MLPFGQPKKYTVSIPYSFQFLNSREVQQQSQKLWNKEHMVFEQEESLLSIRLAE